MEEQLEEEVTFDGPIPGSALTGELGAEPSENPPEFVDAEDAYADIASRINRPEAFIRLGLAAKQDIPVELIARSLLFSGWAMGKISHDVMLLILPDILELMSTMLDDAGIDHIVLANRKEDPRLKEAIERVKEYESVIKPEENVEEKPEKNVEEKPEEDVEEKPEEEDIAPVTGLMGNRSKT